MLPLHPLVSFRCAFHVFFSLSLAIIPTLVHSQCFSTSSQTWKCDGHLRSNNFSYETLLENQPMRQFLMTNYRLSRFNLDSYSPMLESLNASGNEFQTIHITAKHRWTSNLRQLILESNSIADFHLDTVVLPNSLNRLSLANNRLSILDARLFTHLDHLTDIDLRNNRLKRILPELLIGRTIRLDGNPLDCQCTSESYRMLCESSTTQTRSQVNLPTTSDDRARSQL